MPSRVKADFGTLKKSIAVPSVLDHYSVNYRAVNETYLRADCPLPSHISKESKGSFAVNVEKNLWTCKSTSCNQNAKKKGGDVLDFVTLMEGCAVLDAAKKLLEWFPQNGSKPSSELVSKPAPNVNQPSEPEPNAVAGNTTTSKTETPEKVSTNKPLGFELKGITHHPYLESRGISKELAEKFGVGFFPGKGSMAGRIVFPLRDHTGALVGYCGRAIGNEEPRYKMPNGFHSAAVLYNRHAVSGVALVIVEGFFGCFRVSEAGFPCVALMGSTPSAQQEDLLRPFKFITLMLDPDDAGRAGIADILPRLSKSHYVRVAQNMKSPDDMTPDEIKNVLRYACPT